MSSGPMKNRIYFLIALSSSLLFFVGGCSKGKEEGLSQTPPPLSQGVAHDASYQAVTMRDGGTIAGVVEFKGKVPVPKKVEVTKDQQVCGKSKKDPSLLVSESGAVQNAVVYIADIQSGKKMQPRKVTLNQKDCEYHPHVLAFPRDRLWRSKTRMGFFTIFIVTAREMTRSIWRSRNSRKRLQ
jgi:hypothetical protein